MRSVLERGHRGAALAVLRHHAGHLVAALAMLYMVLATPASAGSASPTGSTGSMDAMGSMGSMGSMTGGDSAGNAHVPLAALLFTVLLFAYGALVAGLIPAGAERLSPSLGPGGLGAVGRGALLAPRGSALREVVMSLGMAAMLITML